MMKHNQHAFTLIECMVFLTITISAVMLITSLQLTVATVRIHDCRQRNKHLQAIYAIDLITKDVRMAHSFYKPSSDNTIVMLDANTHDENKKDVTLELKKNNVLRITGHFDRHRHTWTHRRSSILLKNVKELHIIPLSHRPINALQLTLTYEINGKEYQLERRIAVRNRVIA